MDKHLAQFSAWLERNPQETATCLDTAKFVVLRAPASPYYGLLMKTGKNAGHSPEEQNACLLAHGFEEVTVTWQIREEMSAWYLSDAGRTISGRFDTAYGSMALALEAACVWWRESAENRQVIAPRHKFEENLHAPRYAREFSDSERLDFLIERMLTHEGGKSALRVFGMYGPAVDGFVAVHDSAAFRTVLDTVIKQEAQTL